MFGLSHWQGSVIQHRYLRSWRQVWELQLGRRTTARQAVVDYLRGKKLLLVMDNYEHLLAGADLVDEILQQDSHVKVLVTSRQRLNFQSERLFVVEGLPHASPSADTTRQEADPAVRLFLDRAERIAYFVAEAGNLPQIQRICQLVEGFPLGIELAAALVSFMPLTEIVAELANNVDILSTSLHDYPDRHRSLRAVFESSWALLRVQEQQVLARLAVFRGGFDWSAAQAVARATSPDMASLVNKSLLRLNHATAQRAGRYEMHELLRTYAAERMIDREEIATTHATYFAEFVHGREAALKSRGQKTGIERNQA